MKVSNVNRKLKIRVLDEINALQPIHAYELAKKLSLHYGTILDVVRAIRLEISDDAIVTTPHGYKTSPSDEELDYWQRDRMKEIGTRLDVTGSVVWTYATKTNNQPLFIVVDDLKHAKRILDYQLTLNN